MGSLAKRSETPALGETAATLEDSFGRVFRKLRLSVVDKCNFRCNFCMPDKPEWMAGEKILTDDEIVRLVAILSKHGIDRVRITGGEPLVRKGVENLVARISSLPTIQSTGITTNGFYLAEKAQDLKNAGLHSVTVSLHSLKPKRFSDVTRRDVHAKVVQGIRAARDAGFKSVKLNAVVVRGYNDDEILDFAELAYTQGFNVRFIEYMPFDGKRLWDTAKVVTGEEILALIKSKFEVVPLEREHGSTSVNYRFIDGGGEFGIITSISKPFCSDCDRLRITADGKIVPCLFSNNEYDVASIMRTGGSDNEIVQFFKRSVKLKSPGVESMIRGNVPLKHVRPMYRTGG
jgi:cyclic pyranopterin phosphate synthase